MRVVPISEGGEDRENRKIDHSLIRNHVEKYLDGPKKKFDSQKFVYESVTLLTNTERVPTKKQNKRKEKTPSDSTEQYLKKYITKVIQPKEDGFTLLREGRNDKQRETTRHNELQRNPR